MLSCYHQRRIRAIVRKSQLVCLDWCSRRDRPDPKQSSTWLEMYWSTKHTSAISS